MIQTALFLIILVLAVALLIFVKLIDERDDLIKEKDKAVLDKQVYYCESIRLAEMLRIQNEATQKLREENDRLRQLVTRVRPVPIRFETNAYEMESNLEHIRDAWSRLVKTNVATGIINKHLFGI